MEAGGSEVGVREFRAASQIDTSLRLKALFRLAVAPFKQHQPDDACQGPYEPICLQA
jgi:hypothetical protein